MTIKKLVLTAAVVGSVLVGNPGPAAAVTAPQDFTVVKIGANTGTVVAQGLITGAGREENNRLLVARGGPFQVQFSFPEGDLYQTITPAGPPQVDFNPTTCVARLTFSHMAVVTGGTGAYAGATGGGTAVANLTVIRGRNADGSCLPDTAPPIFEMSYVRATGTVTVD
ncbi:MAG: hypothetical protein AVDCRST_MAG10-2602 [uncultured Acidimicrobiales bacterium]|uniref:Secreted protein n=1 Tax=uncultured Acidimicrobiales bacterium TaxID=310071 RepID=A0A6J4IT64_9ACTN|nr:MAG: hypothetical protein AVDCRST_MAG10-2602 [uncultured Acidimicrobiales bacterium]